MRTAPTDIEVRHTRSCRSGGGGLSMEARRWPPQGNRPSDRAQGPARFGDPLPRSTASAASSLSGPARRLEPSTGRGRAAPRPGRRRARDLAAAPPASGRGASRGADVPRVRERVARRTARGTQCPDDRVLRVGLSYTSSPLSVTVRVSEFDHSRRRPIRPRRRPRARSARPGSTDPGSSWPRSSNGDRVWTALRGQPRSRPSGASVKARRLGGPGWRQSGSTALLEVADAYMRPVVAILPRAGHRGDQLARHPPLTPAHLRQHPQRDRRPPRPHRHAARTSRTRRLMLRRRQTGGAAAIGSPAPASTCCHGHVIR